MINRPPNPNLVCTCLTSVTLSGRSLALLVFRLEVTASLTLGSLGSLRDLSDDGTGNGGRDDLSRKSKVLSQVVNALRGEDIVVVSPREGLSDQTSGLQGSHQAKDLQVVDGEGLGVDGLVEVLLGNKSSLCNHQTNCKTQSQFNCSS